MFAVLNENQLANQLLLATNSNATVFLFILLVNFIAEQSFRALCKVVNTPCPHYTDLDYVYSNA